MIGARRDHRRMSRVPASFLPVLRIWKALSSKVLRVSFYRGADIISLSTGHPATMLEETKPGLGEVPSVEELARHYRRVVGVNVSAARMPLWHEEGVDHRGGV